MRPTVENAQLALLLEVAGTPKPGNVDRAHEYPDLRFEQFLAGAVGTREGFERAAGDAPVGVAFERAIAGMSRQDGGNTQFGAVLLVTPLVAAASRGELSPDGATWVVEETTVEDAVAFYEAFEHVSVAVDDPPAEMEALDVRRGSDAEPALRGQELTLEAVMELSRDVDGIAREWTGGFERTFWTADRLATLDGPVADRASSVFLELLAEEADTFVLTQHDRETAAEVRRRAAAALEGDEDPDALADEFVERDINPGTTADIVAGGLFVALERGLSV